MRVAAPALLLLLAAACAGPPEDSGDPVAIEGPVVAHVPPPGPFLNTLPIQLGATANDPDGVASVTAHYRQDGTPNWSAVELVADGSAWIGEIPGDAVLAPGVSYYFEAVDNSPYLGTTLHPPAGADEPFHVDVSVLGKALPFLETFEQTEDGETLYDIGWSEYSEGFPGYPWDVVGTGGHDSSWAVTHLGGIEKIDPLDDWLVSPGLDLSTAEDIQVTWYERGDNVDRGHRNAHELWISTGSPDPADGDFELVDAMPLPEEDVWERTAIVDISGWSGHRLAYLAWRYQNELGDTWTLDDIEVRPLAPDLELVDYSWTALDAGEEGVLTLDIVNNTRVIAPGVVLEIEAEDPELASYASPVALGDIPGEGSVSTDVGLTVDPDHPDNAYIPTTVTATDGQDTWVWELSPVVGQQSLATIRFSTEVLGYAVLTLGTGSQSSPDVEFPVVADILDPGSYSYVVDITDAWPYLPPGPGPDRWWLEVDSTSTGTLDELVISFDGQSYESDDLAGFEGEIPTEFFLPRPPEPIVESVLTTPDPVEPGDRVDVELGLMNLGFGTVGLSTVMLSTSEPDVTVVEGGPVEIAAAGWANGAVADVYFEVLVSDEHRNSRPLELELELSDEVESVRTDFEIEVPWPVFDVSATEVDDDGDRDGMLDEGEEAELDIELTNIGQLTSFGSLSCDLAIVGGSASATILANGGSYGILEPEESGGENDFELRLDSGATGDDLQLELWCVDDRTSYTVPLELTVGAPPWQWISSTPDAYGDTSDEYPFDLLNGEYRCDGTTLDIILESAVPYDLDIAFVEAWGSSNGSDYEYYQLVVQAGLGYLRGYNDGVFSTLSNPVVTRLDDYRMMISVDTTNMGLVVDQVDLGFASGFCIENYYCDHFPDGWGDPYVTGFYTDEWFALSW